MTLDTSIGIEASFSWRLLHRFFLSQTTKLDDSNMEYSSLSIFFHRHLPLNAARLKLETALKVIHHVLCSHNETLSLFVGIDEYQRLPQQELDSLLDLLLSTALSTANVCIYPMFAGTDWSKMSIARSSHAFTDRVPMPFLTPHDAFVAISSSSKKALLSSEAFRRYLFHLGGLPRAIVEFTLGCEEGGPKEVMRSSFARAVNRYLQRIWLTDVQSQLKLIAYALSGITVDTERVPGIGGRDRETGDLNYSFNWRKLADIGLCLLEPTADDEESLYVRLPYWILYHVSKVYEQDVKTVAEKCLISNLKWLVTHVDEVMYDVEPWQSWVAFGAVFHALRMNSLILLGYSNIPLCQLFSGSRMKGCNYTVELVPATVMQAAEKMCKEIPATLREHGNEQHVFHWLQTSEEGIRPVVINGSGGEGVDVFFALKVSGRSCYIIVQDQRKYSATTLGTAYLRSLYDKANIVPQCAGQGAKVVVGLFSQFPRCSVAEHDLPQDCFVVSFSEHKEYHGSLFLHPASSPCIDVNCCTKSMLTKLHVTKDGQASESYISPELAEHILSERPFQNVDAFCDFLREKGYQLSESDKQERVLVY